MKIVTTNTLILTKEEKHTLVDFFNSISDICGDDEIDFCELFINISDGHTEYDDGSHKFLLMYK